jgi:hypothetical protein
MLLDMFLLFGGEPGRLMKDGVSNADLSYVVQQTREIDIPQLVGAEA